MRLIVDPSIFRTKYVAAAPTSDAREPCGDGLRYLGLGVLRAPVAVPPPATSDPVLPFAPASPVWSGPFPGFSEGPLPTDEEVFPDFPVSAAF